MPFVGNTATALRELMQAKHRAQKAVDELVDCVAELETKVGKFEKLVQGYCVDALRVCFTLPTDGEHLLASSWQHIFCIKSRGALSPGCGAYCSPAATEIKPVRKAGRKIIAEPPDKRRRDLDNILKAPLDALTHAGLLIDDEQFDEINIVRGLPVPGGRLGVKIYEITGDNDGA